MKCPVSAECGHVFGYISKNIIQIFKHIKEDLGFLTIVIDVVPDHFHPGPDFPGIPRMLVIIVVSLGICSLAIFFWKTSLGVNMAELEPCSLSELAYLSYLMAGPSRPLMGCQPPPPPPCPLGPQPLSATEGFLGPLIPPPLEHPLGPETPFPAEGLLRTETPPPLEFPNGPQQCPPLECPLQLQSSPPLECPLGHQ
nr:uncharacterized protein LOC129008213 [Pongo pygmaeus]